MNCHDISRLLDGRGFDVLTPSERDQAAGHASACPHCAPDWVLQPRVDALRIPAMPAELALRCRTLWAAQHGNGRGKTGPRRVVLVGGTLAMAAAAGMLALQGTQPADPESVISGAAWLPSTTRATPTAGNASTREPGETRSQPQRRSLPLLPVPNFPVGTAAIELAVQRAVARYPELAEGPEITDTYVVAMATRRNGAVVTSALRLVSDATAPEAWAQLALGLPRDAGGTTSIRRAKGSALPDGRALRAPVMLKFITVPDDYDERRSDIRVREIVRAKYADLMLPASGDASYRVTIFLDAAGHIEREDVELASAAGTKSLRSDDPNDLALLAERFATRLGLSVEQIGLMGVTTLEDDARPVVKDAEGKPQVDAPRRILSVFYAWQRQAGEKSPLWGQQGTATGGPGIDLGAALAIVESQIPDAFTLTETSAGVPAVVLTAKGELIRAGRIQLKPDADARQALQEQLVPGVQTSARLSQRLTNARGATADVYFAWEDPAGASATLTN